MKKLVLLILIFFCIYFRPWENDFPIPQYNSKEFFNKTYSNYFYYSQEIKQNRLPLWNPLVGNGSTFLTESDHSLFNPINLVVLRILPFPFNLKILYFLSYLIAGTGIYLFLRSFKNEKASPFAGACIFVFSGPFLASLGDLSVIQSISLIPWVFLLAQKPLLGSFALALQTFSGSIEISLLTILFVFLYYRSRIILITTLLAMILSAVKIIPFFDLYGLKSDNLEYFFMTSASLSSLKIYYPTITAIIALLLTRKNFYFLWVFIFCLVMALPALNPFYVFYLVPPFNLITFPEIFFSMGAFFLAVAASLSWHRFLIIFLLTELLIFNFLNLPQKTAKQSIINLENKYPFIKKIQQEKAKIWFNNLEYSSEIKPLEPNNNLLWQIPSLNNYELGLKRHQLFMSLISTDSAKLLALQSVKYQINPEKEITNFLPNQFETKKVKQVKKINDLIKNLTDEKFIPQEESLVEERIDAINLKIITQSYCKCLSGIVPVNLNQQGLIKDDRLKFSLLSLNIGFLISFTGFICLGLLIYLQKKISFLRKFL